MDKCVGWKISPNFGSFGYLKLIKIQGVNKRMDPLPNKFAPFYTIFPASLRILTLTVYYHLSKTNLVLTCYIKNFKKCWGNLFARWRGRDPFFLFTPCRYFLFKFRMDLHKLLLLNQSPFMKITMQIPLTMMLLF